ncbi:MAG: nucleotidyltransferase domain-containing protein [Fimbriimonadaceae bacterium]
MMSVLLDPQQMERQFDVAEVVAEGERLLQNSISYAHKLDRIRYLKQLVTVKTAALDLANLLPQEQIWKSLNDLAEGVLTLIRTVVWEEIASKAEIEVECPVAIVGMGKFGGQEINYSSDLDLVFVIRDDADDQLEKLGLKFAERLRAALADHMGRGDLYRVDLRLRPFGSQGPMVSRMKSVENYYQNYAEPWEHLAMIRSRIVGDVDGIAARWEVLRQSIVFRGARSEGVLDSLQKMRARIDNLTTQQDLKRGPGGIRDVEFLTQTFQMLAGHREESLRIKGTIPAVNALQAARLLPPDAASDLIDSYRFLRQLEHRCQIIGGLQTHELPPDDQSRLLIANSLGMTGVSALMTTIDHHRTRTRRWYEEGYRFSSTPKAEGNPIVRDWLSALQGKDQFLASLARNRESAEMAERIVRFAPALIPYLKSSVFLTEQVLSSEILDSSIASDRFAGFAKNWDALQFAKSVRNGWALECLRFVLGGEDLGGGLAAHYDLAIEAMRLHFCPEVDLVGLGSYAANDLSPDSDLDLIAFVPNESEREKNEKGVLDLMRFVKELRNLSALIDLDFRLRPEGGERDVSL